MFGKEQSCKDDPTFKLTKLKYFGKTNRVITFLNEPKKEQYFNHYAVMTGAGECHLISIILTLPTHVLTT